MNDPNALPEFKYRMPADSPEAKFAADNWFKDGLYGALLGGQWPEYGGYAVVVGLETISDDGAQYLEATLKPTDG